MQMVQYSNIFACGTITVCSKHAKTDEWVVQRAVFSSIVGMMDCASGLA